MMNQIGSRLVTVAAALSISGSALAKESPRQRPAEKAVQVRQQETVTRLQACMDAGFDGYISYKRMESGETRYVNGALELRNGGSSGKYISGVKIINITDPQKRSPQVQISEAFMDKGDFDGQVDTYIKDLSQWVGEAGFENQAKVCYGTGKVSERASAELEKLGIGSCTAQMSQQKAQSQYEGFLAETLAQCEVKAETDMGFASKFKAALKKLVQKRTKKTKI